MEEKTMTEKEILSRLEQLRDSTQEAIKWLDMPSGYRKNVEALDGAIQIIKEHRKAAAKIWQLKRSLNAQQERSAGKTPLFCFAHKTANRKGA